MAKEPRAAAENASGSDNAPTDTSDYCGVVRPISSIDGYPATHWLEVHEIITEAAASAGFVPRLVSDDEAIGVILGRIVSNLHDDPIAVVDISTLNPNVMFELGMRLTFDRPVVIIKDTLTKSPFDTSPLEYLEYPADLRHSQMVKFRERLASSIRLTAAAPGQSGYRSFLKHFGSRRPGTLGADQTNDTRLILEELQALRAAVLRPDPTSAFWLQSAPRRGMFGAGKSTAIGLLGQVAGSFTFAAKLHSSLVDKVGTEISNVPGVIGRRIVMAETDYSVVVDYAVASHEEERRLHFIVSDLLKNAEVASAEAKRGRA